MADRSCEFGERIILIRFPDGCERCPLVMRKVAAFSKIIFPEEKSVSKWAEGAVTAKCEEVEGGKRIISIEGVIGTRPVEEDKSKINPIDVSGICLREKPKKAARS